MTTTPTPTTVPVTGAGIGFTAAFSEINGNFSAIQAWGQSVDTLLSQMSGLLYTPPVAAYAAPAVGGLQVYGANGTAWATAASTGKVNLVNSPYVLNVTNQKVYADVLSMSAGTVFSVTSDSVGAAFSYRTITISAGVPTVTAGPLALTTGGYTATAYYTFSAEFYPVVVGAVAVSPTVVKILYGGAITAPSNYQFTGFSVVTNTGGVLTQVAGIHNASTVGANSGYTALGWNGHRRGYLIGSQSWLAQAYNDGQWGLGYGWIAFDRGPTLNATLAVSSGNGALQTDNVGGGFFVRAYISTRPIVDAGSRATVELDYADDQNFAQVAILRIVGQTCASIQGLYVLSSTLAALLFTDTLGNRYISAVGINTSAPSSTALTMLSTTNATSWSAAGLSAWTSPIQAGVVPLYSATDIYIPTTFATSSFKLTRLSFNPATLAWSYISQVNVTLGGASSGAQTTAIAGLSSVNISSLFLSNTDQLAVLYYASATTSGFWLECFALS